MLVSRSVSVSGLCSRSRMTQSSPVRPRISAAIGGADAGEGAERHLAGEGAASQVRAWLERVGRHGRPMVRHATRGTRLRSVDQPRRVDDLEVTTGDDVQLVHHVVVEVRIAHAADVPGRAVVGQDHPVALERVRDDPRLR